MWVLVAKDFFPEIQWRIELREICQVECCQNVSYLPCRSGSDLYTALLSIDNLQK